MHDVLDFFYIILISVLCGFIIGFEREIHNKPAGLKTVSLVVLGSAIFTFVSVRGFNSADDSRVAAQIVSGIGFLGAGVILRSELKVIGLTTAATLWVASAIGILIGTGMMYHAIVSTLVVFFVVNIFRFFESKITGKYISFDITLFLNEEDDIVFIRNLADSLQMKLDKFEIERSNENYIVKMKVISDITLFFENFVKELKRKNIKYTL